MDTQVQSKEAAASVLGDRREIEDFLINEAALLDERRFEEWRDLFADDGRYWVPMRPGQDSPDECSLFYDDRNIMQTRFERLRHPNIHSQNPPHRTCHIVSNVVIENVDVGRGEVVAKSKMILTDYRSHLQRLFSGQVLHRLRRAGAAYKIVLKRVDLINCDDVFELIAVPF
jgi:3-phenylpropionate/cinnamic acid dioxygenase small subunit